MFSVERVFCQLNVQTGLKDWLFSAREGNIGPFSSKSNAENALKEFIAFNIENGIDGGRNSGYKPLKLDILPADSYVYQANIK